MRVLAIAVLALTGVSAAESPQVMPVAVAGPDGAPLVGVGVQAQLLAPSGESLDAIPLGSSTTDSSGVAQVAVDDGVWSDAIPLDTTTVSVEFSGPDGVLFEVLYIPPDRSASGKWELDPGNGFDGLVEDAGAADAATSSLARGTAGGEAPGLRETSAGPAPILTAAQADPSAGTSSSAAAASSAPNNPYSWCAAQDSQAYVSWRPLSDLIRRRIPIQRIRTYNRSQIEYQWETTRRTTLEVMTTARGGSHAAGGMSYSMEQSGSTGVEHRLANNRHVIVKAEWQYRRYRAMCVRPESTTPFADSGWRKWRPRRYTGGSFRYTPPTPAFTCNRADHATQHAAEWRWTQSTRGTTWKGWFEISGVGLRSTQRLSTVEKLGLRRDAGESQPWSCGSNDFFVWASQGREITPP